MKIITMYELLGLVKDGKAPKRIKYGNVIYKKMDIDNYEGENFDIKLFDYEFFIDSRLNDEVEILEEKKIPEKLPFEGGKISDNDFLAKYISHNRNAINEIIDYLEYCKSKGE